MRGTIFSRKKFTRHQVWHAKNARNNFYGESEDETPSNVSLPETYNAANSYVSDENIDVQSMCWRLFLRKKLLEQHCTMKRIHLKLDFTNLKWHQPNIVLPFKDCCGETILPKGGKLNETSKKTYFHHKTRLSGYMSALWASSSHAKVSFESSFSTSARPFPQN